MTDARSSEPARNGIVLTTGDRMDEPKAVTIPFTWPNPPPTLRYSNQFVVEIRDTLVSLTFGQVSPVLMVGTPQEQHDHAVGLSETGLEVQDVTRVVLSMPVAVQLLQVLAQHIGQGDPKE